MFPLLYDVRGVQTIEEARSNPDRLIIAENFTVPAQSTAEFTTGYKTSCSEGTVSDFAVLETGDTYLYDNASVIVHDDTAYYTVEYLDKCTGQRICPDLLVADVAACSVISAHDHIRCLPCWKFVCAIPYHLHLCEGENILKLYYVPC